MTLSRRFVRIKVLNVLYAYEIAKDPIAKVKKDLLTEIEETEKLKFAINLIDYVINNEKELDTYIIAKLENWGFERVALIDKLIIRMATAEILYFPEIPPKVSINEAIEIAKIYSLKNSGSFVNGILDSILNELKSSGKINKKGRGLLDLKKKSDEQK
ncbi:MAG: transcription antitermination factor NusB [Ignavibacteria bacterium]|nr:transcription antitermination factor NusB [Ignavibacteria bacterium]